MSLLYPDALPKTVCIDGEEHAIRWKFYAILTIMQILDTSIPFEGEDLLPEDRVLLALDFFYRDDSPRNLNGATEAMLEFIRRASWDNGYEGKQAKEHVLDWELDAPFIWASMKQTYPFWDWSEAHWWEFKAAFDSLPASSKIKEVMAIRLRKVDSKMSPREREALHEMKRAYALPVRARARRKAADIEAELKAKVGGRHG